MSPSNSSALVPASGHRQTMMADGAPLPWLATMPRFSYARHQFPPAVIQHAVWLYMRFTLSYRDVENLL